MSNHDHAHSVTDPKLELTAHIVSTYVANNNIRATDLASLITNVHQRLVSLDGPPPAVQEPLTPAVSIRKSVAPDHLVCLEDGKKFKSIKRHLGTAHGLTPAEYRAKWNLPGDYPMVASNYSNARSDLAREMGLGRKAAPAKRRRKAKAKS